MKQILAAGLLIILAIGIFFGLSLLKQKQEIRSKASSDVALVFKATDGSSLTDLGTISPGASLPAIDVWISAGSHLITGFDITVSFGTNLVGSQFTLDPQLVASPKVFDVQLIPSSMNSGTNNVSDPRTIRFAAVNTGQSGTMTKNGSFKLGTLNLQAENTSTGSGSIRFTSAQIVATDTTAALTTDTASSVATYRVASTTCPYQATVVKFRKDTTSLWLTDQTATKGTPILVAAFHDQSTSPATDISFNFAGPGGESGQITDGQFTPQQAGTYTVTAQAVGLTGSACQASGTLTVGQATAFTQFYAIAEDPTSLATASASLNWLPFSNPLGTQPVTVNYQLQSPLKSGDQRILYVRFKDNLENLSDILMAPKPLVYIGASPSIHSIACSYDSQSGVGTKIVLTGQDFGSQGKSSVSVITQSGSENATITSWGTALVTPLPSLTPDSSASPSASPAPATGSRVEAKISDKLSGSVAVQLTIDDGRIASGQCVINTTTLSFTAKTQCRLPGSFASPGARVQIAEDIGSAKPIFDQKIDLDGNGQPSWTPPQLQVGTNYQMIIKASNGRSVAKKFTALEGTTVLEDFDLPVGDIAPLGSPDNAVNSLDVAELYREWNAVSDVVRTGDFNLDGRVNSLDYACLRNNINTSGATFIKSQ